MNLGVMTFLNTLKEAIVTCCEASSCHVHGGTEEILVQQPRAFQVNMTPGIVIFLRCVEHLEASPRTLP
jgi:hypothetical protein